MKVTMADIAKMAGVSKSLVSRVINNDKTLTIPDSTRQKIWDEIEKSGYIPDSTARALACKSMGTRPSNQPITIGYVTFTGEEKHGHPFFSMVLRGIEEEIIAQECKLGNTFTCEELGRKVFSREIIKVERMDGLIFLGSMESSMHEILMSMATHGVCLDNLIDESMDFVGTDYGKSGVLGIEHLISLGYKRIGFISGTCEKRMRLYKRCLQEHQLSPVEEWILDAKFDMETAYTLVKRNLEEHRPPEAIFAWNDEMAIGCMRALLEKGYKIPKDIAVVGHDDISMAPYASVPLTTVKIFKEEIGKIAVRTIIDRMKSKRKIPLRIEVPAKLVIRESCGAKGNKISIKKGEVI